MWKVNPQCTLPIVWERLSRICKAGRHLPQVEAALPAGCPSLLGPGTRDTGSQQHPPPQLAHRAVTMAAVGPEWTGLTCRDNNRRSGNVNSWWYTVVFIWRKMIWHCCSGECSNGRCDQVVTIKKCSLKQFDCTHTTCTKLCLRKV